MSIIRQWTQSTFFKILTLLFVLLLLSIALLQIEGTIYERGYSQTYAEEELAQTYVGEQTFTPPVLVVPYIEEWDEIERNSVGKEIARYKRNTMHYHTVMADSIHIDGNMTPEPRYRGIFEVQFYQAALTVNGQYPAVDANQFKREHNRSTITPLQPYLTLNLSDIRGLQGKPTTTVNQTTLDFSRAEQGTPRAHHATATAAEALALTAEAVKDSVNNTLKNSAYGAAHGAEKTVETHSAWHTATQRSIDRVLDNELGILRGSLQAPITDQALQDHLAGKPLTMQMTVQFAGQQNLQFLPVAQDTHVQLQSAWQDPSFSGSFLPKQRSISASGFTANWNVSSLITTGDLLQEVDNHFGVKLFQPVNTYTMSERAVKYGFLFVALTLMVVFMVELFRKLNLHPVQYGLVGLGISFFFLLLLALSEKIGFAIAYFSAASATVLLLGSYFTAILKNWKHGMGMAGFVALLYGALYGLLKSQDNALLMGTLLLFGLLATLMLMTRHVDWYALTQRNKEE